MVNATAPPTPDFYRYALSVPSSVELDGRFVRIAWPDGVGLRAFDLWLAENTMGVAIDLTTRESVLDPADLDDDLRIARAEVDGDGAVAVTWQPGGHRSLFHPGWLRHVAEGGHRVDASLPDPQPWTTAEFDQPPTRDGAEVLADDRVVDGWLCPHTDLPTRETPPGFQMLHCIANTASGAGRP